MTVSMDLKNLNKCSLHYPEVFKLLNVIRNWIVPDYSFKMYRNSVPRDMPPVLSRIVI